MVGLLAAATESSMPIVVFCGLAALVLGSWAWGEFREYQANKRSEEIRNLYATVHSAGAPLRGATGGDQSSRDS